MISKQHRNLYLVIPKIIAESKRLTAGLLAVNIPSTAVVVSTRNNFAGALQSRRAGHRALKLRYSFVIIPTIIANQA
jgi:hypothetical protein